MRGALYFNPRPPRGGRLIHKLPIYEASKISIHALREEGDRHAIANQGGKKISIHALREEGDANGVCDHFFLYISIHALREEGDAVAGDFYAVARVISIHALREEGDPPRAM